MDREKCRKENMQIDEAIKIIFMVDDKELIKFLNEILGSVHDPENTKVVRLASEFIFKNNDETGKKDYGKLVADTVFKIGDTLYNIEFQTSHDGKMIIRIAEYQLLALLDMLKSVDLSDKYNIEIDLPRSIVIQLEKSSDVPDYYNITYVNSGTKEKLTQQFPIVKMWEYSIEDLSTNGRHMLLPFKSLEHRKKNIDVSQFVRDALEARKKILELYAENTISEKFLREMCLAQYHIVKMVAQNYVRKNHPKRKEVENMFVEVKERPSFVDKYIEMETE
ncbi:MAG: hypothetical protein FWG63_01840, partial [Defluviitaleaceae bacterium]|nr:hypothetical protein [Defluviitaleaceae bacterium]